MTNAGGLKASEMERTWLELPMRAACALCTWTSEGLAAEVLAEQQTHLQSHGLTRSHTRKRHLLSFRQPALSDEETAEIEAIVARRKRLHGIDEEVAA